MTINITAYTTPPLEIHSTDDLGNPIVIPAPQYPDYISIDDAFGGGTISIVTRSVNGTNHAGIGIPYDEFARMIADIITTGPPEVIKKVNDLLDEKGNLRRDG